MLLNLIVLYLKVVKPKISKFGVWTRLEKLAAKINEAVESNITEFPILVTSYISTALFLPAKLVRGLPWIVVWSLFLLARDANTPTKIPLLMTKKDNIKEKKLGWDYDTREEKYWVHLLAKEYGWELEYIQGLDTNVALAHIQEILTEEQLDREFLWSMSEIAYPYNSTTKQARFSPLPRPYFMQQDAPELKKIKIRKDMLPVGVMQDVSGMEKHINGLENKTS